MTDSAKWFSSWPCPYCQGAGATAGCAAPVPCEECDGTGTRYHATWTTDDDVTCSMMGSGSQPPDANTRAAMEMVCRAALGRARRPEPDA